MGARRRGPPRALRGARLIFRRRRRRFADLIDRQLDLFAREHGDLLEAAAEASRAYDLASRDEATERYEAYRDLVETGAEALAELRDAFAGTLEPDAAEEYEAAFLRAAIRRFPRLGADLEGL